MHDKVDLAESLASFEEPWSPRIVARDNDEKVVVVKADGEFVGTATRTPATSSSCSPGS